jgi:hypothetical protein
VLLVTNSDVSTDPRQRDADLSEKEVSSFLQQGIVCCSAVDIYQAYRDRTEGNDTDFWSIQEGLWQEASTANSEA